MDKYEYRLKAEQIEKLVKKQDYDGAARIADTVDWRRVKNLNMLYMVSEVYEKTERYGECMEILDMAYDRAPVGRMLLYRMTEVCTKMHNFDEAISLYREFVKAAPHDQSRFILKYQIYRERGSSLEDQIKILSEYKTHEYQEKWAYELAALYDEAGMSEECVHECDELILWFSEGEYVTKALELKMKYEPLTAIQQEKYNYQRIGLPSSVHEDDFEEPEVPGFDPGKFSTMNLQAELAENLDELLKEDATIEFPSLEVQEASAMEETLEEEADEKPEAAEAVLQEPDFREDATIDLPLLDLGGEEDPEVKTDGESGGETAETEADFREDATIDLPVLDLGEETVDPEEETAAESEKREAEADLREDATIDLPVLDLGEETVDPKEKTAAESEKREAEADFREDATIDLPVLDLGEETVDSEEKTAAESEKREAEADFREDATIDLPVLDLGEETVDPKEEAAAESEKREEADFREDATIDLPVLDLGEESVDPKEETAAESEKREAEADFREDATIDLPVLDLGEETVDPEGEMDAKLGKKAEAEPEKTTETEEGSADRQITGPVSIEDILEEWEQKKAETEAKLEAEAEKEKERKKKVKQETAELLKLIEGPAEDLPEDVQQILEEIDEEKKAEEETVITEDDLPPDLDQEEETEEELSIESLEEKKEQPPLSGEEMKAGDVSTGNMIQDLERSLTSRVSEGAVNAGHLTKEQARLFAYFTSVQGMSEQLSVLFKEAYKSGKSTSSSGNLTITGERGNGKTTLAIDIVKALQKQNRIEGKKLAKISGQKLNTKDIYDVLTRLKGGALIIERAGGLSDATMMAMSLAMETDTGGLLVILEDSTEEIGKLFLRNRNFASKFDYTIDIPVFTNDELVAFGRSYALEQEYSFDEFGILALYDRIGSRQTNDHLVTVAEVKELIDAAIEHAEKGSFRHLLDRVTRKSVDEFGNHLIRESDFVD